MSVEQTAKNVITPFNPDARANILLEKRLVRRSEEILDRVQKSKESQRVTQKTMNLEFTI